MIALFFLPLLALCNCEESDSKGPIIGIDLGTTYSCVGIFKAGHVDIIQNDQGKRITPSYVAFTGDGERLVGDAAKNQLTLNPENTLFDIKRLIGRRFDEESVQSDIKNLPFTVFSKKGKPFVRVKVGSETKEFAPEEISAMVLSKMKTIAENFLGTKVDKAVITTPAYFNDEQRQSTKDAGTIAGLDVRRIINEPTAAALAYGLNKVTDKEKRVLVYDLGGGTFDVSLLLIESGVFEVLSTNGDTHLGGEDFDFRVMKHLATIAHKQNHPISPDDTKKSSKAFQRLRREVEKAKRELSVSHEAIVEVNLGGPEDFTHTLTRAKFEELNMELFKLTLKPLEKVLSDAGVTKSQVDEVILVGGSTRIPYIQRLVKEFFNGKEPTRGVNPDEAVAFGAAVQGGILSGDDSASDLVLLDVNALTLGIEVVGGVIEPLIKRNTGIPTKQTKIFSTVSDNQDRVMIVLYEGERSMAKDNRMLGQFELTGIPKAPRGVPQIEVTLELDHNGIIHLSAVEKGSGKQNDIVISSEKRQLNKDDIDRMISDAEKYAAEDQKTAERVKAKSDHESKLYSLRNQLKDEKALGGKIAEDEKEILNKSVDEAISWLEKNPSASIEEINEQKTAFDKVANPILTKYAAQPGDSGKPQEETEEAHQDL